MNQVTYIPADEKEPLKTEERFTELSLEECKAFLGDDIELVHVVKDMKHCHLIVHGSGHLIGLPHNSRASEYYRHPPFIVGPAILLEGAAKWI